VKGFSIDSEAENSKKDALFQAAELGDVNLIRYLLDKGLDIDGQDDKGETLLHYAARRGHSLLVDYLLKRHACVFVKSKKGRTALLEAYTNNQRDVVKKITKNVLEKSTITSLLHAASQNEKKDLQAKRDNFINECKKHIRKNYLNRDIFSRLMARHNGRAKALVQALGRCTSIKEAQGLIKNQCDLFSKGKTVNPVASHLLASRWSSQLKNKPSNVVKSSFYQMLKTMPRQKPIISTQNQQPMRIVPKPGFIKTLLTSRV
jgi:ankyrin repeat protein